MELGTAQLKLANLGLKRLTARITFGSFFSGIGKVDFSADLKSGDGSSRRVSSLKQHRRLFGHRRLNGGSGANPTHRLANAFAQNCISHAF